MEGGSRGKEGGEGEEGTSLPFREVIVSYLVPALHPLIQRNNDIQPAVSISPFADLCRCTVASPWHEEKVSSSWKDVVIGRKPGKVPRMKFFFYGKFFSSLHIRRFPPVNKMG